MSSAETAKPVEVNANFDEWLNNGVNNFVFGMDLQRRPLFSGLSAAGSALALGMVAKGVALSSLFTPVGLPVLGISALMGLGAAGLSYLIERRHNLFKTTMPSKEGDKKVKVSFSEWLNNSLGNFFLGKNRERSPIIGGLAGMAAGGLTGLLSAPFLGPVSPVVATAVGTGIGGAFGATNNLLFGVRRENFKTSYPTAA